MAERNINVQVLEKKGDRNIKASAEEISPKEVASDEQQSHSTDVNLDMESNTKPPQVIEAAQEQEPSQAIEAAQEPTKASQVIEAEPSQEPAPSQITEAAQEPEIEGEGLGGFDLNQEGNSEGSASIPAARVGLPFDLNVVDGEDLENHILAPSDLQESPKDVTNGRLKVDLNHWHDGGDGLALDLNQYVPSPPASPSLSSSLSSVAQHEDHLDEIGMEEPHIQNHSLLHGTASAASVVRIMGANVVISPERSAGVDPKTPLRPSNGKITLLFGSNIGETAVRACSPSDVDERHLLPLFSSSSSGCLKRKEPEDGFEPYMAQKKVASSSSPTAAGKRKEPEGGQEPCVAEGKRICPC